MIINNSNYSIMEISQMIERKDLLVNRDYQRGSSIWPPGPSSYFIDTILEKFPFPKIYMYEYLDKTQRGVRKEIVDGQQRIGTILRYYNNEFVVAGDSRFAGKKFNDLDDEAQENFLSYAVSVDVIRNASRSEILQMFRRMNAYTLPLNEAEKRHSSFQGKFKWLINDIADALNEMFVEFGVFTNRQIVRMSDAALISDCILAFEKGIISTSPKDLRDLYKKNEETIEFSDDYERWILEAIHYIEANFGPLRKSFIMKPYALHSLVTALVHNKFGIPAIEAEIGVGPSGSFCHDPERSLGELTALALAHEAKELEGPYGRYVWGSISTTDRRVRRMARVVSILRALGVAVPEDVDAKLPD